MKMLNTAEERRTILKDELVCLEKDLSETTDPAEYVVVNSLHVTKGSVSCVRFVKWCGLSNRARKNNSLKENEVFS